MSQQQTEVTQRRKRRLRRASKYKIRVRYCYHQYKRIETEDFGTYADMYAKYKNRYDFWCADLPPEWSKDDNTYSGFRLSGDKAHAKATLRRYGRNKCWIDPFYKINGKAVCLVYNASY